MDQIEVRKTAYFIFGIIVVLIHISALPLLQENLVKEGFHFAFNSDPYNDTDRFTSVSPSFFNNGILILQNAV